MQHDERQQQPHERYKDVVLLIHYGREEVDIDDISA
jgi:hypothetical protein